MLKAYRNVQELPMSLLPRFALCHKPFVNSQLKYLGYKVSHKTIVNVLKKYNLEPCPDRMKKTTWNEFIKTHYLT